MEDINIHNSIFYSILRDIVLEAEKNQKEYNFIIGMMGISQELLEKAKKEIAIADERLFGFKLPIAFNVKYELMNEFRRLVEAHPDCKVKNVIEIKTCRVIQYWIDCPKSLEALISDYAFMTWIANPVFQKYYHGTPAFEKIANKYIAENENKPEDKK